MTRILSPVGALVAAGLFSWSAPAAAQVDFSVTAIEVVQTIQTGATPLTAGKSTMLRTSIRMTNGVPGTAVDGLLRVFVDGVETPDSPLFSDNGPIEVVTPIDKGVEDHTLNFSFVAPAGDVSFVVEVNPAGPNFVPEANPSNNQRSAGPFDVVERGVPEMAYAPIDYRPSGGPTPNLPDAALIEPGVGDSFIQGIYPGKDWFYHRTDAPSKLWTNSLSGTGSSLLNSLATDINLMVPKPDFLYGWVPGSLPYNGQAFINGDVSMGNTQPIRHQRTFAHEVGHNTGLFHNNTTVLLHGVDVEHHLAITQGLSKIKPTSQKDIMAAGLLTEAAWVANNSYSAFLNDPEWAPTTVASATATLDEGLFVAGLWDRSTGAVEFTDVLTIPDVEPTLVDPTFPAELLLRTTSGGELVQSVPITTVTAADCTVCATDAEGTPAPVVGFMAIVPKVVDGRTVDAFEVDRIGSARVLKRGMSRTASAPSASVDVQTDGATATVSWEAHDADGDALRYDLRYSPDGETFTPVATGLDATSWTTDVSALPRAVPGEAFFELFVTDGLDTTIVRSDTLSGFAALGDGGNPPWVEILTPDDGASLPAGATALLHSSGWDLEDRGLTGDDIQWTSSLDGAIASGRMTSTASLSVGTHVITVRATDSDGLQAADTATLTIEPRGLPTVAEVCQTDLGSGGPGDAVLSVCGGDLSSGTVAELSLVGAAPSAAGFLVVGLVNDPTPTKGGVLVPVPALQVTSVVTDASGELFIGGVDGGGGPLTLYVQAVIADAGLAGGFAFSNALQVDVLP